jgi:nitric oxide reductase subunit B
MMGVYGMLALGLAMFCLRYLIPADRWPEKWAKVCFWSTNIGLAWMCFATLLPLGIAQLYKSVNDGYWEARSSAFLTDSTNKLIEWLRLPGDLLFIAGGAVPALYGVRHTVKRVTLDDTEGGILFTEITGAEIEAAEASAAGVRS